MEEFIFKYYRSSPSIKKLRDLWDNIVESNNTHVLLDDYNWHESFLCSLDKENNNLHFFVAFKGVDVVAILPVEYCIETFFKIRLLSYRLPWHPHWSLRDIVISDQVLTEKLLKEFINYLNSHIKQKIDLIYFPQIIENSKIEIGLKKCKGIYIYKEITGDCDYLKCTSYQSIINSLSKNFRKNLKKAKNKIDKLKNVEFITVNDINHLKNAYSAFLNVESSGWKGIKGKGTAILLHNNLQEFYELLVDNFSKSNDCEIDLFLINNKAIAAHFVIKKGNTSYLLKIGYDEQCSKYSPGNLLLEYKIKELCYDKSMRY